VSYTSLALAIVFNNPAKAGLVGPDGPLVDVATVEDGKAVPRDVEPPSILDAMEAIAVLGATSIDTEGKLCSLGHLGCSFCWRF
jgi:hypothetical protein